MFEGIKRNYNHMIMDAKALLRGERRVAEGYRGRTHTKKDGGNDLCAPKAKPVGHMEIKHVVCGKTGKIYTKDEWIQLKKDEKKNG